MMGGMAMAAGAGMAAGGMGSTTKLEVKYGDDSTTGCCRICPEQFSGIDIMLETAESVATHLQGHFPAVSSVEPTFTRHPPRSPSHANLKSSRFTSVQSEAHDQREHMRTAMMRTDASSSRAADSATPKTKAPPPQDLPAPPAPPPVPLTVEQLLAMTPCCPVCLEQFDPPVDPEDDAAFIEMEMLAQGKKKKRRGARRRSQAPLEFFLETGEAAHSRAQAEAEATQAAAGQPDSTCCTICPDESNPVGGTFDPGSFVEIDESIGAERVELFSRLGAGTKAGLGSRQGSTYGAYASPQIKGDGCCNQCPASMFESDEIRFQEPQGGPFGLQPRVKSVSSVMPMVRPPAVKKAT